MTYSRHFFRDAGSSVQIEDVSLGGLSFSIFTCPPVTVEGRPHTWGQLHNTRSVRVCVCVRARVFRSGAAVLLAQEKQKEIALHLAHRYT